jgi:hypothetical protein
VQAVEVLPPATQLPAVRPVHRDVATLRHDLLELGPKVHLLSPTQSPELVPQFHEIAIRVVRVRADEESGEVYKPQGARGDEVALTKVSLDRIARAAGISWDPVRSGRLDDRSDPDYCHFRAVGHMTDLDGRRVTITGEKEIDLRDGNPRIKGWSAERLGGAREHILAMCESKAANRVIRKLGVKQKYTKAELAKPFAVLALVLTGAHPDPERERDAQNQILAAAIATSREIYPSAEPVALPPPREAPHAPPAIDTTAPPVPDEDDEPALFECSCPEREAGVHTDTCEYIEAEAHAER